MYALPVIIVSGDQPKFYDGTLVHLPPELHTPYQMDWYVKRTVQGWNKCPQGYYVFVATGPSGDKYIVPGLNIIGEKRSSKKFYQDPHSFEKDKIRAFAHNLIEELTRIQKAKDEDVRDLIHDLRALSTAIYNSATEAKTLFDIGHVANARDNIETVIATQTMLSIRIDLLGYMTSEMILTDLESIEVFRKVDKVVRCFRPKAHFRRITIALQGPSFAATYGPAVFELIPYAVIDNAIKYSPYRGEINVRVQDEVRDIFITVSSFGPLIEPTEIETIFAKGYRGVHATELLPQGTGIGLHTAKELLEKHFNGSIRVKQEGIASIYDGRAYYPTLFEIRIPRR